MDLGQGEEEKPFDPHDVRWKPRRPRPPVPDNLDPALDKLLDTFWMSEPTWPPVPAGETEPAAPGPRRSKNNAKTRPITEDDFQSLCLHRLLAAIDPNDAPRWHWRDARKVRRAIERWWERGGGDVRDVKPAEGNATSGRRARFRTLIYWVFEPLESLRPRLDKRVDRMMEVGHLHLDGRARSNGRTDCYGKSPRCGI